MSRTFFLLGAVLMFVAVALGAFGAHALAARFTQFPDLGRIYDTAVRYHMVHALALFAVAWASSQWTDPMIQWAGWLLVAGIFIFSGSLYLLSLTGVRWLGAITPIGGVCFLAGWGLLFFAAARG